MVTLSISALQSANWYKWVNFVCLCAAGFSLGSSVSIMGPTLVSLKQRLCTDYTSLSVALLFRPIGGLIGSLVGGLANERWRHWINCYFGCLGILVGISMGAHAWANSVTVLRLLQWLIGLGEGWILTGCTLLLMLHWDEQVGMYLTLLYAAISLGDLFSTLLALPFLRADQQALEKLYEVQNRTADLDIISQSYSYKGSDQVNCSRSGQETYYFASSSDSPYLETELDSLHVFSATVAPYQIIGGITILIGIFVIMWSFVEVPLEVSEDLRARKDNVAKDTKREDVTFQHRVLEIIIAGCYLVLAACATSQIFTLLTYTVALAVEGELHMPQHLADELLLVYLLSRMFGRFVFGVMSRYVDIKRLYITLIFSNAITSLLLTLVGMKSVTLLWILLAISGFVSSPADNLCFAFVDRYIVVSGILIMLTSLVSQSGNLIQYAINGAIFDNLDPWYTLVWVLFLGCAKVFFVTVIYYCGRIIGDRFEKIKLEKSL